MDVIFSAPISGVNSVSTNLWSSVGLWCLWLCPPSYQRSGECPMDVTETDPLIGLVRQDMGHFPSDDPRGLWSSSSLRQGPKDMAYTKLILYIRYVYTYIIMAAVYSSTESDTDSDGESYVSERRGTTFRSYSDSSDRYRLYIIGKRHCDQNRNLS